MPLTTICLLLVVFYGAIFIFRFRIKIFSRTKKFPSYEDLKKLVEQGDPDALTIKRRAKYFWMLCALWFAVHFLEKFHIITLSIHRH
jgi:hypothetical protein